MLPNMKLVKGTSTVVATRTRVVTQEHQIMALGKTHHWPFRVLGIAPVPEQPIFLNNWWLVPAYLDTSPIPARALERVRTLHEAGFSLTFVLAHQAEKQLKPPAGTPIVSPMEYWSKRILDQSVALLKGIGTVVAVVTPIFVSLLGTSLLLSFTVAGALLADPILCAITSEGVWIAIDEWMA